MEAGNSSRPPADFCLIQVELSTYRVSMRGSSAGIPKYTVPFTTRGRWEANTPHALGVWQLKTTLPMAGAIPVACGRGEAVATLPCRVPWPWALHPLLLLLLPQPRTTTVLQKMRSKQIIKPPPKSPNLPASLIQKKHHAGQDRTGQDSKALGGGKVSKREGEERGPDPMQYREGSEQASQGYVMAMQGVDRDRCQWTALPKCNLPQPCPPTYFWRAASGVV